MTATIQKPKRKLQRKPVSIIQDIFSPKAQFEFVTSYSFERCLGYLEREQQQAPSRLYGPSARIVRSQHIESDIVTFSLPVRFGERRQEIREVGISGSLESLNDGSTVIRGEVTNDSIGTFLFGVTFGLLLILVALFAFKDALWLILGYIALTAIIGTGNRTTKRDGIRYIQSVLCPLDDCEFLA